MIITPALLTFEDRMWPYWHRPNWWCSWTEAFTSKS